LIKSMSIPYVVFCLLVMSVPAAVAEAQDVDTPAAEGDRWVIQVTPYVWAAGIRGDVSQFKRGPVATIEKSFGDVLEDLNFAAFANFWVRKDRFVFAADVAYIDLSDNEVIDFIPALGATVDVQALSSTLQAGYRVYEESQVAFDVLAGARGWFISTAIDVSLGGLSRSVNEDFGWVDPVIASRGLFKLTDKVSLLAYGDIGGFGAGSRFTWQVLATVNYAFTKHLSVSGGYKILSTDYSSDGHVFDTTLAGPAFGVTYRF
jgi:hypothetical protein